MFMDRYYFIDIFIYLASKSETADPNKAILYK